MDKNEIRALVVKNWGPLPPYSTLAAPLIEEVQKASAGSGAILTFMTYGKRKVVLAEAGSHYGVGPGRFMIFGGHLNLTSTPGSLLVQPSDAPESPRGAAAREIEEEMVDQHGKPLIAVDPDRLWPIDCKTLRFKSGEVRLVIGMVLDLTHDEAALVSGHVLGLGENEALRDCVSRQTINEDTGLPEVRSTAIFDLSDIVDGKVDLLHQDQLSLFKLAKEYFYMCDQVLAPG